MIFCFSPSDSRQAVADFRAVRGGRWDAMPRHRRRAAVRAAWHVVQREAGESWPEFWKAELVSRQG